MGIFNFWKKNSAVEANGQFLKAATSNAVDRRAHVRVRYPLKGAVGGLPQIYFGSQLLTPLDISAGGLRIKDTPTPIGKIGAIVDLKFIWTHTKKETAQKAQILRIAEGRTHLMFIQPSPELAVSMSFAFKAGYKGAQTRRLPDSEIPKEKDILEFWLAPNGANVVVYGKKTMSETKIKFGEINCSYSPSAGKFLSEKNTPTADDLDELLVFITNFKKPSDSVQALLSVLEKSSG